MHTKQKSQKLKFLSAEKWKTIRGYKGRAGQRYAISSLGRLIKFYEDYKDGYILKTSDIREYPGVNIRNQNSSQTFLVHRLVAQYFCPKPSAKHKYVIHLDHNKKNNRSKNLKWATLEETTRHKLLNPANLNAKLSKSSRAQKLDEKKVKTIKRKLASGSSSASLAKEFNVSSMTIDRVRSGASWGYVKV